MVNLVQEEFDELLALSCLTHRIYAKNFVDGLSFLNK